MLKKFLVLLALCILSTGQAQAQADDVSHVLTLINQARVSAGLTPLALNPQLTAAAQGHVNDLLQAGANMGALGHNGSDGSTPLVRILRAGFHTYSWGSFYGENWAAFRTIDESMNFWLNDPPHRENILRVGFREIGIGVGYTQYGAPVLVTDFGAEPNVLPVFVTGSGSNVSVTLTNEDVAPLGDGPKVIGRAVRVDISTNANFSPARGQAFANSIPFASPDGQNISTVYVRFYDAQGRTTTSTVSSGNVSIAPAAISADTATLTPTNTDIPTERLNTPTPTAPATELALLAPTTAASPAPRRATATRAATSKPRATTRPSATKSPTATSTATVSPKPSSVPTVTRASFVQPAPTANVEQDNEGFKIGPDLPLAAQVLFGAAGLVALIAIFTAWKLRGRG